MNLPATPTNTAALLDWTRSFSGAVAAGWVRDHRHDGGHEAIREYGRVTPSGVWVDISHHAAYFTGSASMLWSVDSADVAVLRYMLAGMTMWMNWDLRTTSVGGTPDVALRIALPTGYQAVNALHVGPFLHLNNGVAGTGLAATRSRNRYLELFVSLASPNWTASLDNTRVVGQLAFEVETY